MSLMDAMTARLSLRAPALLAGRVLIAAVFVYDAVLIVQSPAEGASYLEQFGVPGILLYPAAVFEFVAGLMVALGLAARPAALALSGFCVMTALIFHRDLGNPAEALEFGKDIGLAGGFLFLAAEGAGRLSLRRSPRQTIAESATTSPAADQRA